jgi:hypothetical protein
LKLHAWILIYGVQIKIIRSSRKVSVFSLREYLNKQKKLNWVVWQKKNDKCQLPVDNRISIFNYTFEAELQCETGE